MVAFVCFFASLMFSSDHVLFQFVCSRRYKIALIAFQLLFSRVLFEVSVQVLYNFCGIVALFTFERHVDSVKVSDILK